MNDQDWPSCLFRNWNSNRTTTCSSRAGLLELTLLLKLSKMVTFGEVSLELEWKKGAQRLVKSRTRLDDQDRSGPNSSGPNKTFFWFGLARKWSEVIELIQFLYNEAH